MILCGVFQHMIANIFWALTTYYAYICWERFQRAEEEKRWQRIRLLDSITSSMNLDLGKLQEMVRATESLRAAAP